jgi:isopenicillin-N epimerase
MVVRWGWEPEETTLRVEQICPDPPEWFDQMATIPLPPCDADELKRRLYDEHRVEVPVIEWDGREFVRASVQGYNTRADGEALVAALAALLPKVSR